MGNKPKEDYLKELQKYDIPTIANAIEIFNIRPRIEGFMSPDIKCILPYKKTFIGYASTAKVSSLNPPKKNQKDLEFQYYEAVRDTFKPTIAVVEDIDSPPIGSYWGEIKVSIHKALGCIATITNGGVRDLTEVEKMGFGYFANCVLVSHGYVHIVDYNCPVKVGGLLIKPGDLLCADRHGVISIPLSITPKLAQICGEIQDSEKPVLEKCQPYFTQGVISINEIKEALDKMKKRRPKMVK